MELHTFAAGFLIICINILTVSVDSTQADPICVVGAGISGLNLARLLQTQGNNVIVIEQNPVVGGKMDTYRQGNNILAEMCPLLTTSASKHMVDLVNRYGLKKNEFNATDRLGYDAKTGMIAPIPEVSEAVMLKTFAAIKQYKEYHDNYSDKGDLDFPYLNAPQELFVPMSQWLAERNLTYLTPLFNLAITTDGYGHLDDVPALYIVQFLSPRLMRAFVGDSETFFTVDAGLDWLAMKMAGELNVPPYVNMQVTGIVRRSNDSQILYLRNTANNARYWTPCSKVILAFPPLLKYLEPIMLDMTEEERCTLSHVKIHKFTSAVHYVPKLQDNLYMEFYKKLSNNTYTILSSPPGNAEMVALVKQSTRRQPDIFTSYSWIRGDFDDVCTPADYQQIYSKLQSTLFKMSNGVRTYHIKKNAHYFPHVNTTSLQNGFYQNFENMQGRGGLYYATTMLRFESMDSALVMTEQFMDRYFGNNSNSG